jgi:hypothetical protein
MTYLLGEYAIVAVVSMAFALVLITVLTATMYAYSVISSHFVRTREYISRRIHTWHYGH